MSTTRPARTQLLGTTGAILLCALASRAQAQSAEMLGDVFPRIPAERISTLKNETGLTLGDLFDQKVWVAVAHPLRLDMLKQIGEGTHRAPRPGVQFELLTPGAAGITIHLRW